MRLISDNADFDHVILSKTLLNQNLNNLKKQLYKNVVLIMTAQKIYIQTLKIKNNYKLQLKTLS